ncbi:DUF262 domain-containing protein [Aliivibrio logei]|uniref:DUF262 domain-containing protein n=1 Tax=Aliivibrio logei TaxID=688 RepID=UPI0035C93033
MDIELLENERMEFKSLRANVATDVDHELANEKYIRGDVRIVTEQARYPLNTIVTMVESPDYNLNPEFQRRHRWNNERKSRLIESFIINVPIPPVFLYEVDFSEYEVMDGLQRLTAISQFYKDEFALEGLTEWKELDGCKYSTLPVQIRRGIDRRYLSSIILLQETAKDEREAERLKQMVFERINSGGEKLKAQEIRNALYSGRFNSFCIRISRNQFFCKMWNIPEPDAEELKDYKNVRNDVIKNPLFKEMSDVELCLRFFAYRQIDSWLGSTMEVFLDEYLKKATVEYSDEMFIRLEKIFNDTCELAYSIFGELAFCLHRKRNGVEIHYERPTKVLYDPIMHVLSTMLNRKNELIASKDKIVSLTRDMHLDNQELFDGRRTTKKDVNARFSLIKTFFEKILND